MPPSPLATPVLSLCLSCRDGFEDAHAGERAGSRLARATVAQAARARRAGLRLRGVRCMSQCRRPCVASLTAAGGFTYVFGDLDPGCAEHAAALLALAPLYATAPEGFLRREERPEPLRERILARLPPPDTASDLVTPLPSGAAT